MDIQGLTPDTVYFVSDAFAVFSCLGMSVRFLVTIRRGRNQQAPVRKAMFRVGGWIILLFVVLGFFIGIDTANALFHLMWRAGHLRNFGVGFTVLVVGEGLSRDLAIIYAYIERPAAVAVPSVVPVEYPPIPPMPTRGTAEEFARYANSPVPPMPTKKKDLP